RRHRFQPKEGDMLGVRWIATRAGAPDSDEYETAVDTLCALEDGPLQEFPKRVEETVAAEPKLAAAVAAWAAKAKPQRIGVMVHGFDFDVGDIVNGKVTAGAPEDDPFRRVFAKPGEELADIRPESWLPIVGESDAQECAVAFGWDSAAKFFRSEA